jgi:hypothetical protein
LSVAADHVLVSVIGTVVTPQILTGARILVAVVQHEQAPAFSAYTASLPPRQRGALILILWVNAVLTPALQAAQLVMVATVLRRAARGHPFTTVVDCAASPLTATVLAASAFHKLARERFARKLDRRIRAATIAD